MIFLSNENPFKRPSLRNGWYITSAGHVPAVKNSSCRSLAATSPANFVVSLLKANRPENPSQLVPVWINLLPHDGCDDDFEDAFCVVVVVTVMVGGCEGEDVAEISVEVF